MARSTVAGLSVRNRDVIHVQSAAKSAFVVGLGLLKVGERAELRPLRGDQISLSQNHVVDGGRSEAILLLRGIEGLLLEFAGLAGGFDLRASLRQGNVGVANVQQRRIF